MARDILKRQKHVINPKIITNALLLLAFHVVSQMLIILTNDKPVFRNYLKSIIVAPVLNLAALLWNDFRNNQLYPLLWIRSFLRSCEKC